MIISYLIILLSLISGCKEQTKSIEEHDDINHANTSTEHPFDNSKDKPVNKKPPFVLKNDSIILATVNNKTISLYDLDATLIKMFGHKQAYEFDKPARQKALKSLVMSSAIAQVQEKSLTQEEQLKLEKKVNAYKEELLVKDYLQANSKPEPVTEEMITTYYSSHPEKFGYKLINYYEMLKTTRVLTSTERNAFIQIVKHESFNKNWDQWIKNLISRDYPVTLIRGHVEDKMLHYDLRQVMKNLKKGDSSDIIFINDIAYKIKMTDEKVIKAKPLEQVRASIIQMLRPIQLKNAIKKASEQVYSITDIKYEKGIMDNYKEQ